MVDTPKEINVNGGRSCFGSSVGSFNVEAAKANGITVDIEAGPSGSGSDGLLTYKRRRNVKVSNDSVSQPSEKKGADYSYDCSLKHKRDIILDQICQSLDSGGLKKCIQSALVSPTGSGSGATSKESCHSYRDWREGTFQTEIMPDGVQNAAKSDVGLTTNGSVNGPSTTTYTEHCTSTFLDAIMSEQFARLCSLLLENFQGMKANKLFDLNQINTRMKEKAYEHSPSLFQTDVQEIWTKLQKVGSDITALARCLSEKTTTSFRAQVGNTGNGMSEGAKHEFVLQTKQELIETCTLDEAHTCRHCREKTNGVNGLVCDSCEEIYHISCIEPAVKEIPSMSWYCANCTAKGIEASHENCIACERLNALASSVDGHGGEDELINDGAAEELEGSSNDLTADEEFQHCSICRTEVSSSEEYRICGHSFCPHKFYHEKCLTAKQLISFGSCWYCPSCLCRACLADRDDDKIVLCDGCDHGYHIYCMQPPLSAIPKGKWFCQKCHNGIQRIQRARRMYESMHNTSRKRTLDGKLKNSEALNKSGGVEMLLNAAKTLNYEENLAAMQS